MKIGILTFQHSINFGAQLQCYALQETLKQMGHEVKVIQFIPKSEKKPFFRGIGVKKNGFFKALFHLYIKLVHGFKIKRRFKIFSDKYLNKTEPCTETSISAVTKDFDAIVVGSDQVWGYAFHSSAIFFIGWIPEFKGKRISYAPCCAINKVDDIHRAKVEKLLKKFSSISVRNIATKN